ncbi:MAG: sulfatase-like hydrolase/transferase [Oscillospiraceae bacterium]|nr:sulfatase-like hydrolase/transferase [Oscillospiraceae bacterium]
MKKPNFLIFMTDHQRGDMVFPGIAKMPNLERFYPKAVVFSHAYCPSPHCCPSRATFFSGLYPSEHGVWNNIDVPNALSRGLYEDVELFPRDLANAGYKLYFSGKWHVSAEKGPADYGFEMIDGKNGFGKDCRNVPDVSGWKYYDGISDNLRRLNRDDFIRTEAEIIRPGYPLYKQYGVNENPFRDYDTVESALTKIKEINSDEPFLMYVGATGPHDPYTPPQRFLDMYNIDEISLPESFSDAMEDKPAMYRRIRDRYAQLTEQEHRECIRHYLAFCSYEDYLFGKLLDAVEERGLAENTVIMYLSDHGDYAGAHGLWAKGLPCFKEAYSTSCVIGGGGIAKDPGRVSDAVVSLADFAPTILELAGVRCDRKFAGKSLTGLFRGEQSDDDFREYMFTQSNGNEQYGIQRSVFSRKYKYIFNGFDYDEFYDLEADPNETVNQINNPAYKEIIRDMCRRMWVFAKENRDDITNSYIMTALMPYGPGIIY